MKYFIAVTEISKQQLQTFRSPNVVRVEAWLYPCCTGNLFVSTLLATGRVAWALDVQSARTLRRFAGGLC